MKLSTVEFVHTIISKGIVVGASDIHIDPYAENSTVRFRVDGLLRNISTIPAAIHPEVISRIKILSNLRTDVHHAPQDGRFRHECDICVAILPTQYGENAVLRLLDNKSGKLSLADLGFSGSDGERIKKALSQHNGLILITGPTGSGKTTTLYSLIDILNNPELSIVSLEDPIEYAIPGVRQVQVDARYGITFANGLRAILRQDPNIIVVGEIRDSETAQIAIHAALTGHLVLSTLHTTSACSAVSRLLDMGVEPYLVADTLSLVVGQRLVRKQNKRGRVGVYETLVINEEIREIISAHLSRPRSASEIFEKARNSGMRTMYEDGMEKVAAGLTTHEEIVRVLFE